MDVQPTVFIVDDDKLTHDAVRDLLRIMDLPCEIYTSGVDFLNAYDPSRPGCLVLEVKVPGLSGLQIQQYLASQEATLPLVFLSTQATVSIAVRAMRDGAVHFLEKPFRQHELWDAVQEAIQVDQERRRLWTQQRQIRERIAKLTPKQRDLMEMILEGKTNRAIASQFGLSVRTIELHRAKLMKHLEVKSLLELLRLEGLARNGHSHRADLERSLAVIGWPTVVPHPRYVGSLAKRIR